MKNTVLFYTHKMAELFKKRAEKFSKENIIKSAKITETIRFEFFRQFFPDFPRNISTRCNKELDKINMCE